MGCAWAPGALMCAKGNVVSSAIGWQPPDTGARAASPPPGPALGQVLAHLGEPDFFWPKKKSAFRVPSATTRCRSSPGELLHRAPRDTHYTTSWLCVVCAPCSFPAPAIPERSHQNLDGCLTTFDRFWQECLTSLSLLVCKRLKLVKHFCQNLSKVVKQPSRFWCDRSGMAGAGKEQGAQNKKHTQPRSCVMSNRHKALTWWLGKTKPFVFTPLTKKTDFSWWLQKKSFLGHNFGHRNFNFLDDWGKTNLLCSRLWQRRLTFFDDCKKSFLGPQFWPQKFHLSWWLGKTKPFMFMVWQRNLTFLDDCKKKRFFGASVLATEISTFLVIGKN